MKQTMRNPKTRSKTFISIYLIYFFDYLYYLFEHFFNFFSKTHVFYKPCFVLILVVSMTSNVKAQTSESSSSYTVEEIIVTARKRSESIQDVPVAVSALSVEQVERGNIQRVQDLEKLAPNVEMYDMAFGGGGMSAAIRGLSFDDLEKTFEPTVGTVIDGVFAASNSGTDLDLFDLESVEILRGPQGTIFGRNTIGGVISINRTKPTRELGVKFKTDIAPRSR